MSGREEGFSWLHKAIMVWWSLGYTDRLPASGKNPYYGNWTRRHIFEQELQADWFCVMGKVRESFRSDGAMGQQWWQRHSMSRSSK